MLGSVRTSLMLIGALAAAMLVANRRRPVVERSEAAEIGSSGEQRLQEIIDLWREGERDAPV